MNDTQDRARELASVNPAFLAFLDCARFGLALIVAAGHWSQQIFQDVYPNFVIVGVDAVGGFFVISGFTIRMLYPGGSDISLRRYTVERWSRVLSVILPALILGIVLDLVSVATNPAFYDTWWGDNTDNPVLRILANTLGVSQVWGLDILPFSNVPFWSLSYELGFYVVFGLWVTGHRLFALLALLVYGPNIAFMLPFWLLGALIYELFCRAPAMDSRKSFAVMAGLALAGLAGLYVTWAHGDEIIPALFQMTGVNPQRINRSLVQGAFGFFVVLLVLAWAVQTWPKLSRLAVGRKLLRHLGNYSFPLYLFHFPILVLFGALGFYDRTSPLQVALAFLLMLVVIVPLTPLTDGLKRVLRKAIDGGWAASARIVKRQKRTAS